MRFKTVHSLGSRCQNSDILKHYGYREFSGFFDFMNTLRVENVLHILNDDFNEILNPENNVSLVCTQLTIDPETGIKLPTSVRTSNKFYDLDPTNIDGAIFPHHDLNSQNDYSHFLNCKARFKKLSKYNTLFNYTFNTWENEVSIDQMDDMVEILKSVHNMENFRICYIALSFGERSYHKEMVGKYYDIWNLKIPISSFTGGIFSNPKDNENYINIIESYDIDNIRITKEEIDENY